MLAFRPLLVTNQVRSEEDAELGVAVRMACRKYLGIDLDYLGYVAYDDAVWKAVRNRSALLQHVPDSEAAESIWNIAREVATRIKQKPESALRNIL
jgi:flagellar biosynthesis protein FlhG